MKNKKIQEYSRYHERYFIPCRDKREKVWKPLAQYLQKKFCIKGKVLDLGAGYCNFINNLFGVEKYALDIFQDIKLYAKKDVYIYIQPCTNLDNFNNEYFDVIFVSNLFEHLTDKEFDLTITGIKRILKKSGRLIILQPNFKYAYKEYFDDPTHKNIFTHLTLTRSLEFNSFELLYIRPKFLPFAIHSRLPKSSLLTKLYLYSPYKPFAKQMLIVARKKQN